MVRKKRLVLQFIILAVLLGIAWARFREMSSDYSLRDLAATEALHEAMWYQKLDGERVRCELCFRGCIISEGKRGFCRTRENRDGKLYTLGYGKPCAREVDPVEKEPLLHFLPGQKIYCIATAGCCFRCKFCHNWHISHKTPEEVGTYNLSPKEIVELAKENKCMGISHTYTEPTVFYEYMLDIAKLAKKEGLKNIMHTCGAMNPRPLRELLQYMDGVTVDLKGFTEKFYTTAITDASLEPVLKVLRTVKEEGVWLEIVNLVIPTYNDNLEDIERMCEWIKENLGTDVPLHFSRFSPAYKMTHLPPTPVATLEKAREVALRVGLNYVTIGNVPGHPGDNTYCPKCGEILIHRAGYDIVTNNIEDGRCKFCKKKIPGIWVK